MAIVCTLCRDTGWLIEAKNKNNTTTLEIIPCLIPDCLSSGKKIRLISLEELRLTKLARHPTEEYIMSLS